MIDSRAGAANMQDEMSLEHLDMLEYAQKKKKKSLKEWGMSREHRGQLESALSGQIGTEETHQVSIEMILAYLQKIDAG